MSGFYFRGCIRPAIARQQGLYKLEISESVFPEFTDNFFCGVESGIPVEPACVFFRFIFPAQGARSVDKPDNYIPVIFKDAVDFPEGICR